jgi:hypothetical protein
MQHPFPTGHGANPHPRATPSLSPAFGVAPHTHQAGTRQRLAGAQARQLQVGVWQPRQRAGFVRCKGFALLKNIIPTAFPVNNETKITKKPLLSSAYPKHGMGQKQRVS